MADRGRDFKFSILSDTDRFELDKPADALNKLGVEALETARDLDKLYDAAHSGDLDKVGTDAKDAADDVDKLGTEAKDTANKVDSAFEKIAASSRSNLRKVDDDAGKAKKGLNDFKDEAHQSGREAAASFSGGFDDIGDFIQETAANAFAGFGKIGGAAGLAAAVGIGFVMNSINEANEKIKELRQNWQSIFENADTTALDKRTQAIKDIESAGVNLETLKRNLAAAGVSVNDYISAYVNGGPTLDRVNKALREQNSQYGGVASLIPGLSKDAGFYYDILNNGRQAIEGETEAQKIRNEELGKTPDALVASAQAYDAAGSAAEKSQERFDTTAEAIRNVGDASDEIAAKAAENGQITAKAITKILNEQTKAAREFTKNLLVVQKRGDEEFTTWVAKQPAEVAAAYAKGTKAEKGSIYTAFKNNVGAQQALGTAKGLEEGKTTVRDAAGNVYTVARNALTGEPIVVPVKVGTPPSSGPGSVAAAEEAARRRLSRPIVVPVNFVANPIWRAVP